MLSVAKASGVSGLLLKDQRSGTSAGTAKELAIRRGAAMA